MSETKDAKTCMFSLGVNLEIYQQSRAYISLNDHPGKTILNRLKAAKPTITLQEVHNRKLAVGMLEDAMSGYAVANRIGTGTYALTDQGSEPNIKGIKELPGFCEECPEQNKCYIPLGEKAKLKVDPRNPEVTTTIDNHFPTFQKWWEV